MERVLNSRNDEILSYVRTCLYHLKTTLEIWENQCSVLTETNTNVSVENMIVKLQNPLNAGMASHVIIIILCLLFWVVILFNLFI